MPEVEALGGAIVVAAANLADGASVALFGPADELLRLPLADGLAELPSLVPGRYRVELYGEDPGGDPLRVWHDLEVRPGETLRLELASD